MAEVNPPLYVETNDAYGADELGLPFRDIMGEGVVSATDLLVTAGAGLKSSVAAGAAWIAGDDDAAAQPTYRVRNDAAVLLNHAAADPTNPRIDLVIAEVLDAGFVGVSRLWRLRVVTGTPAGAPVAPATPSDAIALSQVRINAGSGTLTSLTDVRTRSIVGGGKSLGSRITTSTLAGGPPGAPVDGDIWIATAVDANGTRWMFQYNAASGSAYKWEFIGGPAVFAEVLTSESIPAFGSFQNLATDGPSITVARAGDYLTRCTASVYNSSGSGGKHCYIGSAVGNTNPTTQADAVLPTVSGCSLAVDDKYAAVVAASVLKVRYQCTLDVNTSFSFRTIAITPVRIA